MAWSVFKDTLRYNWMTTLLWGLGLSATMLLVVLMSPALEGLELAKLFESMPPAILGAVGVGDDVSVLSTPEGLIAIGFFGKLALIFAAYPVVMGLRATTHEESEGIMDIMLSLPLERSRVIIEKFLAFSIHIIVAILMVVAGLWFGVQLIDFELNVGRLTEITLNLIPIMIFVLATTMFLGALISRRRIVVGIITAFVIASFTIQTVGAMISASWMDPIEAVSFFTYYNVPELLKTGVVPAHVIGLFLAAGLLVGGSLYTFERRDIAA